MVYNFIRFPGGKPKALTLSYDDGSKADIRLAKALNEYGIKCTFNLVADKVARSSGMGNDAVRELIIGGGHEIATHGYYHRALDCVRGIEGIRETLESRLTLEKEFGGIIRGFAYPDRSVDKFKIPLTYEIVRGYLSDLDIAYARTAQRGNYSLDLPEDFLCWAPTAHHADKELFELIDRFVEMDINKLYRASRNGKHLFIWGHAHEFEGADNWELLDEICQKLAGKEDIWYATCMQVYEYVSAYRSLIYSADGCTIYNPSLLTVWFDIDGKLYSIDPGETLNIGE